MNESTKNVFSKVTDETTPLEKLWGIWTFMIIRKYEYTIKSTYILKSQVKKGSKRFYSEITEDVGFNVD